MQESAATGTGDMMDGKKLEELRELVEFLKANEIAEFDMEQDDLKVRIKFAGAPAAASSGLDMAQLSRLMASAPAAHAASAVPVAAAPVEAEEVLHEVKSPIVGTFYDSPSPGAPAFVKIGDQIEVGQVLCIVEAMKLMNEVAAGEGGRVAEIVVENGEPVEFEQVLMYLEPVEE
jgi:acetyl-CoA carboxylase biotin carboxyl carrier protein